MTDIVVKSKDSDDELKKKAEKALGGDVRLTEQSGGGRRLQLSRDQADRLNRMSVEDRRAALGGDVKQMLND